jgi:predicted N-acetyltransferase YhbS
MKFGGSKMEIITFDTGYLSEAKKALRNAFYHENSNEFFNEWEFAENVLNDTGYIPELCLIAVKGDEVIGYNILTTAAIGKCKGLALGPLGIKKEYQNQGIGTLLVKESIQRAQKTDYPWIALLGGDYYSRFGFEMGKKYHITVSDNEFDNEHLQILFLNDVTKSDLSGQLIFCNAFYDENGNLL